jgi:hypothetical protein
VPLPRTTTLVAVNYCNVAGEFLTTNGEDPRKVTEGSSPIGLVKNKGETIVWTSPGRYVVGEFDFVIFINREPVRLTHACLSAVSKHQHSFAIRSYVDDAEVRALETEVGSEPSKTINLKRTKSLSM